jgi:hypothetical protein
MLSLLAFVEHTGASADAYPREAGRVLIAVIDEDRDVRPQARARRLRREAVVEMPRRKPGSGVSISVKPDPPWRFTR